MPFVRCYKCRVCGATEERREALDDPGPGACPKCRALAYHRVPQAPAVVRVTGARSVDGERRFVRPRVVQNRDGSESVYTSLDQARRAEYERAAAVTPNGLAKTLLARANARKLASGVMPGRASTAYREACEEAPR
jgi:hypothetical protein